MKLSKILGKNIVKLNNYLTEQIEIYDNDNHSRYCENNNIQCDWRYSFDIVGIKYYKCNNCYNYKKVYKNIIHKILSLT